MRTNWPTWVWIDQMSTNWTKKYSMSTNWPTNEYELTKMRTNWLEYELTWERIDFVSTPNTKHHPHTPHTHTHTHTHRKLCFIGHILFFMFSVCMSYPLHFGFCSYYLAGYLHVVSTAAFLAFSTGKMIYIMSHQVDVTSWCCTAVEATLCKRHFPTWLTVLFCYGTA